METDLKPCSSDICRTCLSKSNIMRHLNSKIDGQQRTIIDSLLFVCDYDIKISDNFPKFMCNNCEVILCKAHEFKQRCLDSEDYLKHHTNVNDIIPVEFENCTKNIVKDETPHKKNKRSKSNARKLSVTEENDVKDDNFDIFSLPCNKEEDKNYLEVTFGADLENNIATSNVEKFDAVKEEFNHDFDADIDFIEPDEPAKTNHMKVYSCSCGTIFNDEEEYKIHYVKHCSGYKKTANIKVEKRKGSIGRFITIKRQIACPECNLEFNTLRACKLHQKTHNEDETGDLKCTFCMRKFKRKCSYTTHMNRHHEKAKVKYICDTCKREFQHKAHLDNHINTVHTKDRGLGFMCGLCLMSFSTQESLTTHKESHKTQKKHQCKICKKGFYMLSTLNDHMRTHTGERPYLCSVCGKGFSQKTNLAQHMRRHQGLKPFKCEDCDRRFVSKGELVAHTRKHSGAHPFVCDDCGNGFTTSSSLVKHRRIHTGERPYACDLCPMKFAASGTLKNHRRTHTGEKPFQCSHCEKAFVQRQDLISHIRCHTGERPYTCGCGQAFRKASSLKAHVKAHGKDAPLHAATHDTTVVHASLA